MLPTNRPRLAENDAASEINSASRSDETSACTECSGSRSGSQGEDFWYGQDQVKTKVG